MPDFEHSECQDKGPVAGPVPAHGAPATATGTTYVIAIGIDSYANSLFPDFPFGNCKLDCQQLISVLRERYDNIELFGDPLLDSEATLTNITARIRNFYRSDENNQRKNNLILYFSGHGDVIAKGSGTVGCWIPHGLQATSPSGIWHEDVIDTDLVENWVKSLRVGHFLLIADSCKSGRIFSGVITNPKDHLASGGEVISRWAIASSRADQNSKAGLAGQPSLFTSRLLRLLQYNQEDRLLITDVIASLTREFSEASTQELTAGRLQFSHEVANSGFFSLEAKKSSRLSETTRALLRKSLMSLNYRDQTASFDDGFWEFPDRLLTIFSGLPHSGLHLLAYRARTSANFVAKHKDPIVVSGLPISLTDEAGTLLRFFEQVFQLRWHDLNGLTSHIANVLATEDIFVEIRIDAMREILPKDKRYFFEALTRFIGSLPKDAPSARKLIVHVVDQDDFDYSAFLPPGSSVQVLHIPKVGRLAQQDFRACYQTLNTENHFPDKVQRQLFETVYRNQILEQQQAVLEATDGYPAPVIKELCKRAGCEDLALEILEPRSV